MMLLRPARVTSRTAGVARRPLRLECLEERNAPSDAFLYADEPDPVGYTETGPAAIAPAAPRNDEWPPVELVPVGGDKPGNPPVNNPPQITNFTAANQSPGVWVLSGKVVDENPAGLTVTFGGLAGGPAPTAITDANGNFTITINFGSQRGEVWSRTADAQGLQSNFAYTEIP